TEDEALAVKTFSRHLSDHITEQQWETYGPVTVTFVERDDLHTGQMRIDGVVDPDAVPFHISAAAPAPAPGHPDPSPPSAPQEKPPMQAPASNRPVDSRPAAGWGGPSDAPTQITQGRTSLTVTLHLEDGSGRTFRLQRGSNLLGRGQDAAFRLPGTGVSRQHADVRFDGREALLSDLGSTNGTTVTRGPREDWRLAAGGVARRLDQRRRCQSRGTAGGHPAWTAVAGRSRPAPATRTREAMSNAGTRTAARTRPPAGPVAAVHLSGAPRARNGRVRQRGHAL